MTLASIFILRNIYQSIVVEQKTKLMGVAKILENEIRGDFDDILAREEALNSPREEQIKLINKQLGPFTEKVVLLQDIMTAGYYSRNLKSNVVYAPNKFYYHRLGKNFVEDNPLREIYQTGKPVFSFGNSSRGQVLAYGYPIIRGGELVGHTFASIPTSYVNKHFYPRALRVSAILFTTFITLFLAGLIITDYLRKDIRVTREYALSQFGTTAKTRLKTPWLVEELPGLINSCLKVNKHALEELDCANSILAEWKIIYNHLLQTAKWGCLIANQNGIITKSSLLIAEILELAEDKVMDKGIEDIIANFFPQKDFELVGKESWEGDFVFTNSQGEEKELWLNYSKIRDSKGNLMGTAFLVSVRDEEKKRSC